MPSFGENLRQIRLSRGLSQEDFARLIDSNQVSLSSWERGHRTPTFENIKKIAKSLDVPMSSLISISDSVKEEDFINEIAEAFNHEPKLRVLFDRARYLNQDDIRMLVRIAQAFANERIEFGDKA